jgi:hypothetical protein
MDGSTTGSTCRPAPIYCPALAGCDGTRRLAAGAQRTVDLAVTLAVYALGVLALACTRCLVNASH